MKPVQPKMQLMLYAIFSKPK
ncbi:hypothetical protein AGR7A_Lc140070 [Agrobacterium deltaense NCPPB 1641]|uniref:Uncharacterized protein n=1 Tax=Agrobacterium deltaense NCPPB 1641 TaxID=1183425 RepID=A0A1S7U2I1_9HYPH|nr:hypothetical protein AGR7A_Lc140070 [Agrobacterium deltaense NCPPB 1641]